MTLQELLIQHRKDRRLSQRQFAERCGLSNGYISMLESGKNPRTGKPIVPQFPALAKIATGMEITLTELLSIVDDMPVELSKGIVFYSSAFKPGISLTPHESALIAAYRERPSVQPKVDALLELTPVFDEPSNVAPLRRPIRIGGKIPVLGRVPAGIPLEAVTDVIDEIDIPPEWANDGRGYFGLLVTGRSMFPEYLDGDYVIIRQQPTADTGDDVVAYIGEDDATLKRLYRDPDGIELRPLNEGYPTLAFTNREIEELPVSIAGIVVETRRMRGSAPPKNTPPLKALYGESQDKADDPPCAADPGFQHLDTFFSTSDKDARKKK